MIETIKNQQAGCWFFIFLSSLLIKEPIDPQVKDS